MIVKTDRGQELLLHVLDLLELTEKNRALAERYLDLSEPEDGSLLQEVENQNFRKLDRKISNEIYYSFLTHIKKRNESLTGRFVRLVTRIGGTTASPMLSVYGYDGDFDAVAGFLSPVETAALRAEYIAWHESALNERKLRFLVDMGREDPESLLRMTALCYNEDGVNTRMFLTAVYLHCVKPQEEARGRLYVPAEEERVEDAPDRIREMREYLEQRLIGNIEGFFQMKDRPEGEDLERLKEFVRESDPEEPIPPEVRAVLSGRKRSQYLLSFLTFLAFLSVEHSDRFVAVVRLSMALEGEGIPDVPLDSCRNVGEEWFERHAEALEAVLPEGEEEAYIRWAVRGKNSLVLRRMAKKAPDVFRRLFQGDPEEDPGNAAREKLLSTELYGYAVRQLKKGNPKLYEELAPELMEDYRRLAAKEVTERYKPAQELAEQYVLGEQELDVVLPYVKEWRDLYLYGYQRDRQLRSYLEGGLAGLHKRALILECLCLRDGYFRLYWLMDGREDDTGQNDYRRILDPGQIDALLALMDEEQVPASYQIEFLGSTYNGFYDYDGEQVCQTDSGMQRCVEALLKRHGSWDGAYEEAVKGTLANGRILAARVLAELGDAYKETLFSCASDSAKQMKKLLIRICAEHRDWEADMLEMLKGKKAAMRELAVQVLTGWGTEDYREPLTQALEAEKTKKVKELIQKALSADGQETGELSPERLISELLFGGAKRRLSWFPEEERPPVRRKDQKEASEDCLAAILVAYANMNIPGINEDAGKLAAELEPGDLAGYVRSAYEFWMKDGAQAKQKWVLYAASIHGGEEIVPVLYAQIQEWARGTRGAMAAEAVRALALNGTSTALLLVDQIARKFRFRQVKAAAANALSAAAEQLGITREELEDRIVPDLGFDGQMERIFDYGRRTFRVVLTPALTLEVYDEKGKKLKNLPAPGKQDDPETAKASSDAWKLLKKQLKTVSANQALRLSQALGSGRSWRTARWQELFVKNPVMHQFATGLIWGVYEDGKLHTAFRYMEDGSFNTVEEEEYELPEDGVIALVHPLELSEDLLAAWKEQLSDYEIVQPVEQLERPVYTVTEEEKEATEVSRFGGLVLNGLSLAGKLLNMGWYRGEILDGGGYYEFGRMDGDVAVKLEFSGCSVGYENEEVVVYGISFHKPGQAKRAGHTWETERYRLSEVDPRYFSEILLQVAGATASAGERRPYPECRE